MRRALIVMLVALCLSLVGGPFNAGTVQAKTQKVDAWMTIRALKPAVGCSVDVSVEVRSGGQVVTGADVALALSVDGDGTVLSVDRGTTDGSGLAYLTFDTSDGWVGAKTWLELVVNGSYLGGWTVRLTSDGACEGTNKLVDLSGDVRSTSDSVVDSPAERTAADNSDSIIDNTPAYAQKRSLSCEYASLRIATGALGNGISEWDFDNRVGWHENPHKGYRGDINGKWGNTDDYGVYPEPLVPALADFGFRGEVFYGLGETSELKGHLDRGHPTVVWLGMWGNTSFKATDNAGDRYQLTPGMHVMVAYGYDSGGVHLSDPATGSFRYYDWGTFRWMWDEMDGMSLAVSWA
ncbi:MAG: C39 family peptidase [Chloroflexia bacterium]|nr:C39 family peptidase [Chloroflexia bacterium]